MVLKNVVSMVATVILAATMVGCSAVSDFFAEPEPPDGYALVLGARANSFVPNETELSAEWEQAVRADTHFTFFGVSGSPQGDDLGSYSVYDHSDDASDVTSHIEAIATRHTASRPEADVLGAVNAAARSLSGVEGRRHIIIADSMISTTGPLNFQHGLFDAALEDVLEVLDQNYISDELEGTHITIVGLGTVTDPQQPLYQTQVTQLRSIWEAVLVDIGGAESLRFVHPQRVVAPEQEHPAVSQVAITAPMDPVLEADGDDGDMSVTVTVPDQYIGGFVPGSPEFLDEETAVLRLTEIASNLAACTGEITVIGTTSSLGGWPDKERVSTERAEAGALILAGILDREPTEFTSRGVGDQFDGFVPDRDEMGNLVPELAAQNRNLIITADCD